MDIFKFSIIPHYDPYLLTLVMLGSATIHYNTSVLTGVMNTPSKSATSDFSLGFFLLFVGVPNLWTSAAIYMPVRLLYEHHIFLADHHFFFARIAQRLALLLLTGKCNYDCISQSVRPDFHQSVK